MLFSAALLTIEQGVSLPHRTATEIHMTACLPNEGLQAVVWLEHNESVVQKLFLLYQQICLCLITARKL